MFVDWLTEFKAMGRDNCPRWFSCVFAFGILFSCLPLSNESPFGGTAQGLYGPEDDVISLTVHTIYKEIFSSQRAWFVEFYSSWCGHCVSYAPKWKQFASDLKDWNSVVAVAAIDCADDTNVPACRAFDIFGYPTLRLYGPNTPQLVDDPETPGNKTLNTGILVKRPSSMAQLKYNLIDSLTPMFPHLLSPMPQSAPFYESSDIWKTHEFKTGPDFAVLIFESNGSYVGSEVALRLSHFQKQVRVLRFSSKNRLYENLGLDGWPAAGYITRDSVSGQILLGQNQDLIDLIVKGVIRLARLETGNVAEEESEVAKPQHEPENDEHKPASVAVKADKVSMEDLLHTIRNALRNEVGLHRRLDGAKLSALRNFVTILSQYFPADRSEVKYFLGKLSDWIRPQRQIDVSSFVGKLDELEAAWQPWDIDLNTWVDCKGTVPGRRGYTCGLWRLFHTLTIVALEKHEDAEVLPAIIGYVKHFFGCQECTTHFEAMVIRDSIIEARQIRDQARWLWKAHNEVNIRLRGTPSEDPAYPKTLYPNKDQCQRCHLDSRQFDETQVEEYLLTVYSHPMRLAPAPARLTMREGDPSSSNPKNKLLGGLFNLTDIGIFMIVYLSIALLLVFGYLHFRGVTKRRRLVSDSSSCLRRLFV